jgi:spore coat protein JB
VEEVKCDYKSGALPGCAPLALAYVPMQQSAKPAYEPDEALSRGTMFPGLDLPFMNIVNKSPAGNTPLIQVMALDFVCNELTLYLDTHSEDAEAFAALQSFIRLAEDAHMQYTKKYGPITRADLVNARSFTWLNNPWPWDYMDKEV